MAQKVWLICDPFPNTWLLRWQPHKLAPSYWLKNFCSLKYLVKTEILGVGITSACSISNEVLISKRKLKWWYSFANLYGELLSTGWNLHFLCIHFLDSSNFYTLLNCWKSTLIMLFYPDGKPTCGGCWPWPSKDACKYSCPRSICSRGPSLATGNPAVFGWSLGSAKCCKNWSEKWWIGRFVSWGQLC